MINNHDRPIQNEVKNDLNQGKIQSQSPQRPVTSKNLNRTSLDDQETQDQYNNHSFQGYHKRSQVNDRFQNFENPQLFKNTEFKPKTAQNKSRRQNQSPEQYSSFPPLNDIQHEQKIKELYNPKFAPVTLNPKVIETWINETLIDAEHLDIPGVILKPQHKNPISRYHIDRLTLTNSGIPNDQVDRIYRGLFVYSVGFYEMLQKSLRNCQNKYATICSLWKVFSILLEFCCKTNYELLISKLTREHQEELDKIEQEFSEQVTKLTETEKHLRDNLELLEKKKEEITKQQEQEKQLRIKLQEEFDKNVQSHEEEVQLRMKFEAKLNNLHALHRDLQAKYQRSVEDIYEIENSNHQYQKLVQQQKQELIQLRSERVENESKIVYQGERIKQLIQENELKLRQMNDMQSKYQKTNQELEEKVFSIKEMEKQVNEMRLRLEANKSLIEGLNSEKNHLQLSLKENKDLKEQHQEKGERLAKIYEEAFKEMQEYKKQLVGESEIKKDRDQRIEKLRNELETIQQDHDLLDKEHTRLKVSNSHLIEEHEKLKEEFDKVTETLRLQNKARNEKEEQLYEKIKLCNQQKEQIKDKVYQNTKLKKEVEKLTKRLTEQERQNDSMEIKKKSLDKQTEIQRKQMLDKIDTLNELLSNEKDTREMWIKRYENESKALTVMNSELLKIKTAYQDSQLELKNNEVTIQSQYRGQTSLKESNEEMQKKLSEVLQKNETLERDLFTKSELLRTVEDQQRIYIKKLKEDYWILNQTRLKDLHSQDMVYEDLRSQAAFIFNELQNKIQINNQITTELEQQKQQLHETKESLSELQRCYDNLQQNYNDVQDQLSNKIEEVNKLTQNLNLSENNERELQQKLSQLEKQVEDYDQIQVELQEVSEKVKEYEDMLLNTKKEKGEVGQLLNRGVQTILLAKLEQEIQTDQVYSQKVDPMIQIEKFQQEYQIQKKPRIFSAAHTNATNQNLQKNISQGYQSTFLNSQQDFQYHDSNGAITRGGVTMSNNSDNDRVIQSAQRYRNNITATEAIIEEQENTNKLDVSVGMFRRNKNIEKNDDQIDSVQLRRTPTQLHSKQGLPLLKQKQDQIPPIKIVSGQSQPSALQKNSQKMGFRIKENKEKQNQSEYSSKRSNQDDNISNDMLKSIYEKKTVLQSQNQPPQIMQTRPSTQPNKLRRELQSQGSMKRQHYNENIDTMFHPSENISSANRMSYGGGSRPQTKSTERQVRGKASIKTLIKLTSQRET